jgi:hypothetical protein
MRQLTTLRVVCGKGTLNASRSPSEVRNEDLIGMESLTFEHDTVQKEGGALKFNASVITSAPKVLFLWDFMTGAFVQELVAGTNDGKYVTLTSSGIDKTLTSGLTVDKFIHGVEGVNASGVKTLFLMNGAEQMKMYTGGATAVDITTPAADWATVKPTWAFLHNNRMYAGGKSHNAYASLNGNHVSYDTGAGGLVFNVYPGEGEYLVGGTSWRGRAYFFKYPKGIYYLDDSSATTAEWQMKRLSFFVGAVGPGGIIQAADEVFFLSPDTYFHALSAVQEFGDAKSSALLPNQLGTYIRENVNTARLDRVVSCFYPSKRKILFGFSGVGSSVNNLIIGFDAHRLGDMVGFKSSRDECESLCIRRDPDSKVAKPLAGTSDGYVYILDQDARNKDSAGYDSGFITRNMEIFEGGKRRANLKELDVEFVAVGNWTVNIDVYRDGNFSETLSFLLQGTGGILGSFVLDTDILGVATVQNSRQRLHGDCRRVQYQGYNNSADESYSISAITTKVTPGNER